MDMPGKLVTKLTRMNKKGECGSPGRFFPAKFLFFHYAKLVFVSVSVRLFYSETLQGRTTQRKKLELRKHQQNKIFVSGDFSVSADSHGQDEVIASSCFKSARTHHNACLH